MRTVAIQDPPEDLPPSAEAVLRRAVSSSSDGRTVALVFATHEFIDLLLNWACWALAAGVRWFVLVAMDPALHAALERTPMRRHTLLLPRVAAGIPISKITVIGERQRFGLQVLASGRNVVHTDADALWLRDPSPLLQGDLVAERIWGKPLSVVHDWGAAICTGFYFMRSTPATIGVARTVAAEVATKHARQPTWQTSDQLYLNLVLHRLGVRWDVPGKMAPMTSMHTRFHDRNSTSGLVRTPAGDLRLTMLPHALVARACPVLSAAELAGLDAHHPSGKAKMWSSLLDGAFVLHCFPPGDSGPPTEKRNIFMGHPRHTAAELAFQRQQRLWRLWPEWREARRKGPPAAMCAAAPGGGATPE